MIQFITAFFHSKLAPGILLLGATVLALVMENTALYTLYDAIKDTPVTLRIGTFKIDKPLLLWINDGLMAVFFLLVGLEIKREVLKGHLSKPSQLALPLIAAIGGVIMPALIYAAFNMGNPDTISGWAIPAATDIAFALGVLTLLGNRVPNALKVCLVAIAIIDDLAAIIIIALFYTDDTSLYALSLAGAGLAFAFALNRLGVTRLGPYAMIGLFIWACVLKSGVHATLAGVALGLIIPLRVQNEHGLSPLKVMEHALHPWVVFAVIPLFAFVNAGLSFKGITLDTFMDPITVGIILGLFVGKQLGVFVFTYLARLVGICKLPNGVTWLHFYGLSLLTGIGFTMSLFIGTLAFNHVENITAVRLGVLTGSLLSAVVGIAILLLASRRASVKPGQ
ncbi:MAG: Na+/H+ antiporter NhaA [Pseudomonadota bacterium]|nr:Na+/H+ antiporter NhaA [Alphaproteobacteria bacterium]MEC7702265.1 Na+/H+ antiporter NhaA [Pseudomonadota bacterium]MEC9234770.1 Na+/H+ antiporter NhaA [Pseudomonadota bacterium]|tara:strand:+ start:2091 stop:3272 length:1182 start_codon:yes stop_codon:yes gene_type:complete